ncbi:MAG: hypothetical protein JXB62_05470 [Pirellulales bacterium]|nr:hypothetical protein [Pirellulales bacterium]
MQLRCLPCLRDICVDGTKCEPQVVGRLLDAIQREADKKGKKTRESIPRESAPRD